MQKHLQLILLLFYSISSFAKNDKLLLISENDEGYSSIASNCYMLEDKTGKLTAYDFLAHPEKYSFREIKRDKKDLGFTSSRYWIKFRILYNGIGSKQFFIEAARPVTNIAELYQYEGTGTFIVKKSGDGIPFENKDVANRNTVFKVTLFPSEVSTFYMKIGSDGEALNLPIKVWTTEAFADKNYKEQYFLGIYYGVLIFVFLIYLFFYITLRERSFLYYVLYVIGIALLQFSLDGYTSQYLFMKNVWMANHMVLLSAAVGFFFLLAYVRSFLSTSTRIPRFDIFLKVLIGIDILCFVFVLTDGVLYELSYPLINILSLIGTISVFIAIIKILRYRVYVCPFFTFAFVFLMIGICVFILNNLNLIPSSFFTENGMKLGTGFEVVLLSFSMANRFRDLQKAKELAQAEVMKNLEEMNLFKDQINTNLEREVKERTKEINWQKEVIQQKNKDITDSINYAKGIQQATLTDIDEFREIYPDSFVLFRPKDIVSGDFYWFAKKENQFLASAADCTGHGVPGALMSMLGNTFLNEIVNEKKVLNPSTILFELRERIIATLNRQKNDLSKNDGMDIALISIDLKENVLDFSGAYNPLWIIRNNDLIEIKGDKFPIGRFLEKENQEFTGHKVSLQAGDCIYLFSDGYADQFGGPEGKKFKYRQLKSLLLKIHGAPMNQQREVLLSTLDNWKGQSEQVDDILLIGLRIQNTL